MIAWTKLNRSTRAALAALCGCMMFIACPGFDLWPLAYVGFVPLFIAIEGQTVRRAALWGWLAGTVGNAGGFYWITHLLMRFGKLPWVAAFPLFLLMVAYHGVHWGACMALIQRTRRWWPAAPLTLLAPLYMASLELIMPFIFDWYLAITQAWVLPVIQVADLTGPIGVTALLMLVNGMVFDLWRARRAGRPLPWRALAGGTAVLVAALVYGAVRIHQVDALRQTAPKVKVGVVQANIGIVEKHQPGLRVEHHMLHLRESRKLQRRGAELIVWPESSYPFSIDRAMKRDFPENDVRRVTRGLEVPLMFGALSYGRGEPYPYNTAFMIEPDGEIVGRYDKNFLLVFGEYIPFYEALPDFKKWFPSASNFARGTTVTTFPFRDYKIGPLICYEDILPAFTRRLAELRPNLLINITNDAWFGATSEPYEHLGLAVYRSVELRLDLVRAVNTGVSAFVDATGRVRSQTRSYDPVVQRGVKPVTLLDEAAMLRGEPTVYARVGDLFGYLALAVTLWLGLVMPWRRARRGPRERGKRRGGGKRRERRGR